MKRKTILLVTLVALFMSCVQPILNVEAKEKNTMIEKVDWGKDSIFSGEIIEVKVTLKEKVKKDSLEHIMLPEGLKYQLSSPKINGIHCQLNNNQLNIRFEKDYDQKILNIPLKVMSDSTQVCSTTFGLNQKMVKLLVRVKEDISKNSTNTSYRSSVAYQSTGKSTTTSTTSTKTTHGSTTLPAKKQKNKEVRKRKPRISLNKSGIIDWIRVEPSSVRDGDRITLSAHFSEKYVDQIQPGDTITIELPHEGNLSLTGFHKQIQLVDTSGDVIGYLNVLSNQAVITFNQNVVDKTHISGNIRFTCEARNTTQSAQGDIGHLTTDFGISTLPKQTITIEAPAYNDNPGKYPFYYKTGRMTPEDTDHVRWWLSGNMNQEQVYGDIYVIDEIQPGQEMDWDSFRIAFTGGYLNGQTLTLNELRDRGIGMIYRLDSDRFVLRLSESYVQNSQFTATYLTKITDSNQAEFENRSTIYYETPSENHLKDGLDSNMSVKNINISGDADSDQETHFELVKVDSKDGKSLSGAEFTLMNEKTHRKYVARTDKNGYIRWNHLSQGSYTLQETKAPNGYVLNKTIYQITLDKSGAVIHKGDRYITVSGNSATVKNEKKKAGTPRLPETGGSGLAGFFIAGSIVFVSAIFIRRKIN